MSWIRVPEYQWLLFYFPRESTEGAGQSFHNYLTSREEQSRVLHHFDPILSLKSRKLLVRKARYRNYFLSAPLWTIYYYWSSWFSQGTEHIYYIITNQLTQYSTSYRMVLFWWRCKMYCVSWIKSSMYDFCYSETRVFKSPSPTAMSGIRESTIPGDEDSPAIKQIYGKKLQSLIIPTFNQKY